MSLLIKYLKDDTRPVLREVMEACKTSYIKYEVVKGNYQLNSMKKTDLNTIARIFGNQSVIKKDGEFSLARFMKRLQKLFPNENLTEQSILTEYFGVEIISNKEVKRKYNRRLTDFMDKITSEAKVIDDILSEEFSSDSNMKENKLYGHLCKAYKKGETLAFIEWEKISKLYRTLKSIVNDADRSVKLPILADASLGDPHALDPKSVYRNLMIYILTLITPFDGVYPKTGEELMQFLGERNIYRDYISSFVTVYGLTEKVSECKVSIWEMFTKRCEPINLSLANILHLDEVIAPEKVYVIENPAVFERIYPMISTDIVAVICTYGNFKIAGLKLLDKIVETNKNVTIYYSGDYDLGGLTMANLLLKRFENNINMELYNQEMYLEYMSNMELDRQKLDNKINLPCFRLKNLACVMKNYGKVAYQESFVDEIIGHITNNSA